MILYLHLEHLRTVSPTRACVCITMWAQYLHKDNTEGHVGKMFDTQDQKATRVSHQEQEMECHSPTHFYLQGNEQLP